MNTVQQLENSPTIPIVDELKKTSLVKTSSQDELDSPVWRKRIKDFSLRGFKVSEITLIVREKLQNDSVNYDKIYYIAKLAK